MANEKEEALKKLLVSADFKEETYKDLPIQDMIILKNSAESMKNRDIEEKAKLFFEKREEFFMHMIVRTIPTLSDLFCIFCKGTKIPYVTCDEETLNDQVWLFTDEKFAQLCAQKMENKDMVFVVKMGNKQFLPFFTSLFLLGINELVLDKGMNTVAFELTKLVKKPDYSDAPEGKKPVMNPELQLTAAYFAQMNMLPKEKKNIEELKEMEEEMLANLERGKFVVPILMPELKEGEKPDLSKARIPFLKLKNGDTYQPICTDISEFMKFNKDKKMGSVIADGSKLRQMCVESVKGIMLNPTTLGIAIPKEKL